jgi:2-(3-amino-3-carboxypropyl)histidine synthase
MTDYDLEIESILKQIREKNHKSVLIQFPEGMLDQPLQLVLKRLSEINISVYVSGKPSYGICDLALNIAKTLKVDFLIHFGHSKFGFESIFNLESSSVLDIMVIPAFYSPQKKFNYSKLIKMLQENDWRKIGLSSTIQHQKTLKELDDHLQECGFQIYQENDGQILGCNVHNLDMQNVELDGIVSVHAGYFHTHGILLNIDIPLVQFNPYSEDVTFYGKDSRKKALQKRFGVIESTRKAKTWGILGSSRIGQYNERVITRIEKILLSKNLEYVKIISDNINPGSISNFNWVDSWVVSACPRIAIDDAVRYLKPIITFNEFKFVFEEISWDKLLEKGFF